jgi:hypothetical protein
MSAAKEDPKLRENTDARKYRLDLRMAAPESLAI